MSFGEIWLGEWSRPVRAEPSADGRGPQSGTTSGGQGKRNRPSHAVRGLRNFSSHPPRSSRWWMGKRGQQDSSRLGRRGYSVLEEATRSLQAMVSCIPIVGVLPREGRRYKCAPRPTPWEEG